MRQTKKLEALEDKARNIRKPPNEVYWCDAEITLDSQDCFIAEIFSYGQRWREPPVLEHIRESFCTKEDAVKFIESKQAADLPQIFRQITYCDLTENPPRNKRIYNVLFDLRY